MPSSTVHVIQILIRAPGPSGPALLLHPLEEWRPAPKSEPYLVLPAKKTVADPLAPWHRGHSLEDFVRDVMENQLGLSSEDWFLEQEISPVEATFPAVHSGESKTFTLCPVEVWTEPSVREALRARAGGQWLTPAQALQSPLLSPSARAVIEHLLVREAELDRRYQDQPQEEAREESPHRLLRVVPERPTMYAMASRWFSENRSGVRVLSRQTLDQILAAGNRAFNLRVADPYLRYQLQGIGFTWSFFTHKDRQDVHVHSAPSVEIYGVLEGRLELWWKPYHDRGTSAWNHRVAGPGDWVEMDALQCHFVRWLGPGKGVVFKAGPGPLAEVGRLGVKGKTTCDSCPCIKPPEMLRPPYESETDAEKPWGLSVRAIVQDPDGRMLLLRRSAASTRFPSLWELPGGKLDPGESPDEALRREVHEETGLTVSVTGLVGSSSFDLPQLRVANLFHSVRILSGDLRLSKEHDASQWVEPKSTHTMELAPTVSEFLQRWSLSPATSS